MSFHVPTGSRHTLETRDGISEGKERVNNKVVEVAIDQIWSTFGSESFSEADYNESFEENTEEEHGFGGKIPSLQTLIKKGLVVSSGRGQFQLPDEVVRQMSY